MNNENHRSETSIHPEAMKKQKHFIEKSREIGRSDNLYGRMDLDEQNPKREVSEHAESLSVSQIMEALKRSPEIDVSNITAKIRGRHVTLEGEAESLKEVRAMLQIVRNLPGVEEVKNEIVTDDSDIIH